MVPLRRARQQRLASSSPYALRKDFLLAHYVGRPNGQDLSMDLLLDVADSERFLAYHLYREPKGVAASSSGRTL